MCKGPLFPKICAKNPTFSQKAHEKVHFRRKNTPPPNPDLATCLSNIDISLVINKISKTEYKIDILWIVSDHYCKSSLFFLQILDDVQSTVEFGDQGQSTGKAYYVRCYSCAQNYSTPLCFSL